MVFVWSNIENTEEQYELQVILIKLYYIFFGFWDLFVHSEWIWGRVWPLTSCLIFSNWVVILWFLFNQTLKTLNRKKQVTFNVKIQTSIFELLFHCGWIVDIIIYMQAHILVGYSLHIQDIQLKTFSEEELITFRKTTNWNQPSLL